MRVFSSGGGVQSTAALVLSAQRKIDFPVHLFCNVGNDSESPETLIYVREILMPFATENGIEFHEIRRDGETLYQRTMRETSGVRIPVRMANGAPGNRTCTQNYKRAVIRRWLGKGNHVVGLGISMDEVTRMRTDSGYAYIVNEYPLIDLRLSRADCLRLVRDAGLPQPPKSACWFCPYHKLSQWQDLRRDNPALFEKAVELEAALIDKRRKLGKDPVYLTGKGVTLDRAVADQPPLFEVDDTCESGYCMI